MLPENMQMKIAFDVSTGRQREILHVALVTLSGSQSIGKVLVFGIVDNSAEKFCSCLLVLDVENEGMVGVEFSRATAELINQLDYYGRRKVEMERRKFWGCFHLSQRMLPILFHQRQFRIFE
jgi:hypothetical protein